MTADDWRPIASAATLEQRAAILWQIRSFFHRQGFAEVQTPTISRDTVVDRYIDPVVLAGQALSCPQANAPQYYLQSSPEFCMKRLLAAGMKAIYQLGPAYRAGERGDYHNPEFSMLEWYRADESFSDALRFLCELTDHLFENFKNSYHASGRVELTTVITYSEAFGSVLGIDPLQCDASVLAHVAAREGLALGGSWVDQSRDDWLNLLFSECVQPSLGRAGPTIVTNYPASQAALAQVSAEDARTAERYELFYDGVELANGYHELLDADELIARSARVVDLRRSDGKPDLQIGNRLQEAMRAGLPAACGCALGFDRLVMVLLGIDSIDRVIAFPIERA